MQEDLFMMVLEIRLVNLKYYESRGGSATAPAAREDLFLSETPHFADRTVRPRIADKRTQ